MILILSANHLHKDSSVLVKCTRTRRIFKNRDLFENEKISFFIFDWFSSRRTIDIAHRTTLYLSKQPSLIAGYNKTLGSPDRGDPISLSKFRFSFRRRRDGRKTKTEKLVANFREAIWQSGASPLPDCLMQQPRWTSFARRVSQMGGVSSFGRGRWSRRRRLNWTSISILSVWVPAARDGNKGRLSRVNYRREAIFFFYATPATSCR